MDPETRGIAWKQVLFLCTSYAHRSTRIRCYLQASLDTGSVKLAECEYVTASRSKNLTHVSRTRWYHSFRVRELGHGDLGSHAYLVRKWRVPVCVRMFESLRVRVYLIVCVGLTVY